MSTLRASFLAADHIAKAQKPFTIGEDLILPAAKDICCELLGEAEVQKLARVLFQLAPYLEELMK